MKRRHQVNDGGVIGAKCSICEQPLRRHNVAELRACHAVHVRRQDTKVTLHKAGLSGRA